MAAFSTSADIANRGLTKLGAQLLSGTLAGDTTKMGALANNCYDKLRRAELGRNLWVFATRRAALRPIGAFNSTKFLTFATWASGTTYAVNDVVTGSDGIVYFSNIAGNVAHDPTSTTGYWTVYFGPLTAQEFVTTWGAGFTYAMGDHAVGSDGSVYASLVAGNVNHDPVGDSDVHWSLATTVNASDTTAATATAFYSGELVFIGATVYLSLLNGNSDTPPTSNWVTLAGAPTLTVPQFIYPIGSGPLSQSSTRNVYRLPNGFLRMAPRDPKAGSYTALGAPTNLSYEDWEREGNYIISAGSSVLIIRFIADMMDVTLMDDRFCEGLACRIAFELCEAATNSTAKLQAIGAEYKQFMGEARLSNAIEFGPVEQPLDDWLQVRL